MVERATERWRELERGGESYRGVERGRESYRVVERGGEGWRELQRGVCLSEWNRNGAQYEGDSSEILHKL